jgi:hypothetical protein
VCHTSYLSQVCRAYNGIEFNLTNPDRFVLARVNATQLQIPAAVFQSANQDPAGIDAVFNTDKFTELTSEVYVSCFLTFLYVNLPGFSDDVSGAHRKIGLFFALVGLYRCFCDECYQTLVLEVRTSLFSFFCHSYCCLPAR